MKSTRIFAVLVTITGLVSIALPQTSDLFKSFQQPPAGARIMMRWWWFGAAVTKPEIERELRVMKDAGIGGVEVQPVYPLLQDLDMRFDLTLGSGWSFGGAKTPINEAAGQLRIERVKIDAAPLRVPLPAMI